MVENKAPLYSKDFYCVVIAVGDNFVSLFGKIGRQSKETLDVYFRISKNVVFSVAMISSGN